MDKLKRGVAGMDTKQMETRPKSSPQNHGLPRLEPDGIAEPIDRWDIADGNSARSR